MEAEYSDEHVCLSHISETTCLNFVNCSILVTCGHGSARSSCGIQRWDTLCTSGFVDDVMFARNRPGKGDGSRALIQSDSSKDGTGNGDGI